MRYPRTSYSSPSRSPSVLEPFETNETVFYALGAYSPFTGKKISPYTYHPLQKHAVKRQLSILQRDEHLASFLFSLPPTPSHFSYESAAVDEGGRGWQIRDEKGVNLVLGILPSGDYALLLPSSTLSTLSSFSCMQGSAYGSRSLHPLPHPHKAEEFISLSLASFSDSRGLLAALRENKARRAAHKGLKKGQSGVGTRGNGSGTGWRVAEYEWARSLYHLYLSPSQQSQHLRTLFRSPSPIADKPTILVLQFNIFSPPALRADSADVLLDAAWGVVDPTTGELDRKSVEYIVLNRAVHPPGRRWAEYINGETLSLPTSNEALEKSSKSLLAQKLRKTISSLPRGPVIFLVHDTTLFSRALLELGMEEFEEAGRWLEWRRRSRFGGGGEGGSGSGEGSGGEKGWEWVGGLVGFPQRDGARSWTRGEDGGPRGERGRSRSPRRSTVQPEARPDQTPDYVYTARYSARASTSSSNSSSSSSSACSFGEDQGGWRYASAPPATRYAALPVRRWGAERRMDLAPPADGYGRPSYSSSVDRSSAYSRPSHVRRGRHQSTHHRLADHPRDAQSYQDHQFPQQLETKHRNVNIHNGSRMSYVSSPRPDDYARARYSAAIWSERPHSTGGTTCSSSSSSSPSPLSLDAYHTPELEDGELPDQEMREEPLFRAQTAQSRSSSRSTSSEEWSSSSSRQSPSGFSSVSNSGCWSGSWTAAAEVKEEPMLIDLTPTVKPEPVKKEEEEEQKPIKLEPSDSSFSSPFSTDGSQSIGAKKEESLISIDQDKQRQFYILDTQRLLQAVKRMYGTDFSLLQLAADLGLSQAQDVGICAGNEVFTIWEAAKVFMQGPNVFDAPAMLAQRRAALPKLELEEDGVAAVAADAVPVGARQPGCTGVFGAPGVGMVMEERKVVAPGKDYISRVFEDDDY